MPLTLPRSSQAGEKLAGDRRLRVRDRLQLPLLHELLHEARLRDVGHVGRIAAGDGGRQHGRDVVALRRVGDRDVRVLLVEAVDHLLERLLLRRGPDAPELDGARDARVPRRSRARGLRPPPPQPAATATSTATTPARAANRTARFLLPISLTLTLLSGLSLRRRFLRSSRGRRSGASACRPRPRPVSPPRPRLGRRSGRRGARRSPGSRAPALRRGARVLGQLPDVVGQRRLRPLHREVHHQLGTEGLTQLRDAAQPAVGAACPARATLPRGPRAGCPG